MLAARQRQQRNTKNESEGRKVNNKLAIGIVIFIFLAAASIAGGIYVMMPKNEISQAEYCLTSGRGYEEDEAYSGFVYTKPDGSLWSNKLQNVPVQLTFPQREDVDHYPRTYNQASMVYVRSSKWEGDSVRINRWDEAPDTIMWAPHQSIFRIDFVEIGGESQDDYELNLVVYSKADIRDDTTFAIHRITIEEKYAEGVFIKWEIGDPIDITEDCLMASRK